MRPYSGIGILNIPSSGVDFPVKLYEEPGIIRSDMLKQEAVRELTGWLMGTPDDLFLIVTARKGDWLKVEHDDAGRQGWLLPERRWTFVPWDQFLKGKPLLFLKNAPKKHIQILSKAGDEVGIQLTARRAMKVILIQEDWAYVLLDQTSAGWIRWRDHDGRLLVGIEPPSGSQSR